MVIAAKTVGTEFPLPLRGEGQGEGKTTQRKLATCGVSANAVLENSVSGESCFLWRPSPQPSPRQGRGSFLSIFLLLTACLDTQQVLFPPDAGTDAGNFLSASFVAAGDQHACAISDGGLWCWGANANGELGTLELGDRTRARRVGTDSDWRSITAGEASTCGIKGNGQVWCWGRNRDGEVARGDFQTQLTPRQVTLAMPAREVTLYNHACAILTDNSLWCWGYNQEGGLGQNDGFPGVNATAPLAVAAGVQFKTVAAGQGHTCAVKLDGSLYCWGRNSGGHLGLGAGSPGQTRTPMRVGTDTDWAQLSCHQEGCCARKTSGELWCWGGSSEAELGTRTDLVPTRVGTSSDWAQAEADTFFACGLKTSGEVWCWGRNLEGMLGTGDYTDRYVPAVVAPDAGLASQIAVGRFFRCQRARDGVIWCNGKNEHGQAGAGNFDQQPAPVPVVLE